MSGIVVFIIGEHKREAMSNNKNNQGDNELILSSHVAKVLW